MAEFSGQTNDSLSSKFLLRAFNVFKAAKNRACNTKYGSLPGVDLFWDLYFVYMYAYIYCPHVVMSLNGRLLHFADECMMEELGVCSRAGFRVLWLRRLLDVINAQHQQSKNRECPVLVKTDNHACMHARNVCPLFLLLS